MIEKIEPEKHEYFPCGDNGVYIKFSNDISKETNRKVRELANKIEESCFEGLIEVIPAYSSILVIYDPVKADYRQVVDRINSLEHSTCNETEAAPEIINIPVCYGGEYGPDLEYVAEYARLTVEEVIRIHCSTDYLIYMLGFTPGFPYLGGMSERIAVPRLDSPRERILAGSVGIAGKQTGIYPVDSPGGWRIIGKTPLKLFDPLRKPAVLLKAGQYIRFCPVNREEYRRISALVEQGVYQVEKTTANAYTRE